MGRTSPGPGLRRLGAALLVLAAMAVCATVHTRRPPEAAWEDMSPAQLSWAAEGIAERISELEDDLARVQYLQAQKMEQEQK